MEPTSGLPRRTRSSLLSKPWSAELRSKCISGSPISSITVRSSSVSSPVMYNSIFLFNLRFKSRIIRGNRLTTLSIGTMRTFITDSCRFVVTRSKYSICSWNACAFAICPDGEAAPADTSPFFAIISSLTRFIRTSSLSISTRTERLPTFPLEADAFFGFSLASGFAVSFFSCAGFTSFDGPAAGASGISISSM